MPFQYGNPANPDAHERGHRARDPARPPEITHFVAGWAPAGRSPARADGLHAHDPSIQVIAAEPELGDLVYGLRSLDEGFIPPIFDPDAGRPEVPRQLGRRAARDAGPHRARGHLRRHLLGAVVHVGQRIAAELDAGDIVCLLPDGGWKYLSTDAWAEDLETAEKGVAGSLWW